VVKSDNGLLSEYHGSIANLSDDERIKIAQLKLKTSEQRDLARKAIAKGERKILDRERKEITLTYDKRLKEAEAIFLRRKQLQKIAVPDYIHNTHGASRPLSHFEKREAIKNARDYTMSMNAKMGTAIKMDEKQKVARYVESLAHPDKDKARKAFNHSRLKGKARADFEHSDEQRPASRFEKHSRPGKEKFNRTALRGKARSDFDRSGGGTEL